MTPNSIPRDETAPPPESALPPALSVRHASRWYGDVVAVNDISFDLGPGVTGLLGPNGAGKSTILHMMSGLLAPSSGEVLVGGEAAYGNETIFTRVGLVPEREAVYPFLSAWEYALAAARLHQLPNPEAAAAAAIEMVELTDAMHRRMGGYSKGMRQRAKIAAALVHDPQILILDEPFNGTDPRQRMQLTSMLADLGASGRTIVFSSHILEDVEDLAEDVLVVGGGRLAAAGDYRQIRRLMTNRPYTFTVRSSNDRALAALLVARSDTASVTFADDSLHVRTSDFGGFTMSIARLVHDADLDLHELSPADDSLEDVFSYLVDS